MKIFGYIDDVVIWFVNQHILLGWWNIIIIPLEVLAFFIMYHLIRGTPPII